MATVRSNEDAAEEIATEMRRQFGYDMRHAAHLRWLARCIGEVRAEVVDPNVPPHRVIDRWSRNGGGAAMMSDPALLVALVQDCQSDLARFLVPDGRVSERDLIGQLLWRLDGPQARMALGGAEE